MTPPMDTKPKELAILSWNAAGIANKFIELQDLIEEKNIDIFLLQETFLKPQKKFGIPNYKIYRSDRLDGKFGGTLIGIKKNIVHNRLENFKTKLIEHTSIEIEMYNGEIYTIMSVYISPSQRDYKTIEEDLNLIFKCNRKIIAGGDFNSKNTAWKCRTTNPRGKILQEHSSKNGYYIHSPDAPTHFGSNYLPDILDIFLVKDIKRIFTIQTEHTLDSDHNPIILHSEDWINTDWKITYPKIYWHAYQQKLVNINRDIPNIETSEELENEALKIEEEIKNAASASTIIKTVRKKELKLPEELKELIRYKNKLQKRVRLLNFPPDRQFLNQIKNIIKTEINNFRNENWSKIIYSLNEEEDDNNKKLWMWKKIVCNKKQREQPLHGPNGIIYTDKQKAICLSNQLINQFSPNTSITDDIEFEEWIEERALDIESTPFNPNLNIVTDEEVLELIKQTKPKKAPGEDGINNRHLKNLPRSYLKYLTNLYNSMLNLGQFPKLWKNAIIIMVPKPGLNGKFPQNYRPISLLNAISKIGEKIIRSRLNDELEEKAIIPNEQFGFRHGHSTEGQALRLAENIYHNLEQRNFTAALFMDISKAFDKVWHDGIIVKLKEFDISQQIISLIATFLRDRTFQVRFGKEITDKKSIEAGVPQGAVLSPTLYNIYTADIPRNLDNSEIFTYADDTAIASYSRNLKLAINSLQNSINKIIEWLNKWKIKLNTQKCKPIIFTRRRQVTEQKIDINGILLNWNETAKYLGIRFDKKLTWSCHVQQTIDKLETKFGMLSPFLGRRSKMNKNNKILLYKQIIRPTALYGSAVWGTTALSHLRLLETCQNKMLRRMANSPWFVRNLKIREDFKIETITHEIKKRNKLILQDYTNHTNPLLREALNYDPNMMRRTSRPKTFLME